MLVLTRKINETLILGEGDNQVTVTIIGVSGQQVRLGCHAKANVPIHREEIYQRILRERETEHSE